MKPNKIKAIIFDFDGVIAESVNVKTEAFSKIYSQYGNEIAKKVVAHHLSHGGISRFKKFKLYHKNFLGIELNNKHLDELAAEFMKLVVQDVINAPYVPGAYEFIKNNYNKYKYFISTGTPQDEMIDIINRKKLDIYFDSIYGSPEEKSDHIKKILSQTGYNKDELIFIGDADTDILAARENNISIILREHSNGSCNDDYHQMIRVDDLINLTNIINKL